MLLQAKTVFSLNGVQRLVEVGLIACLGIAAFMLLALLSFDPADPSWTQTGYHSDIRNIAGPVGAEVADILFAVFGWLSYLVPPFLAFCGYLLFRRFTDLLSLDYFVLGMRLLGLLLTVISACAISSINFDDIFMYSSGGVVGDVLVALLLPQLSFVGSSLLLLCSFCIGLTLLTGISWLTVADQLGALTVSIARHLWNFNASRDALLRRLRPKAKLVAPLQRTDLKVPPYQAPEKAQPVAAVTVTAVSAPAEQQLESSSTLRIEPEFSVADSSEAERVQVFDTDMPHFSAYQPVAADVSVVEPVLSANTDPMPAVVAQPKAASPIKVDPSVQSRAFFPEAGARVEPLPIQPLDIRTEARAFVSIDEIADDELSYSAIDESYADDELAQSFLHTQSPSQVIPPVQPLAIEEDDDAQDEVLYPQQQTPVDALPSISLLERPNRTVNPISAEDLERVSRLVEVKLLDFNVDAKVVGVYPGPVVTRFELDLAPGVKVSKITGLSKDLARSLSAISVRVVEVIPGKSFIGLELPNQHREIVRLSEVIGDEVFEQSKSPLTMVLGKDIAGKAVVADLAKMPHLLVAGTTGSGKSVGVNVMICSLLYKSTPDDVRFLMIDPKMLELSVYEGIPHLLTEVVTDMKEAANGLRWCVGEMERRYKLMSMLGVRNLKGYNAKVAEAIADGKPLRDPLWKASDDMRTEPPMLEKLPSIVVVIDEFADMMMIVGKKVEELIARIAQKARAAGIHLVLATQRPSVDVITGLIKANIPTRIAFQVSSKIDSRTILDQQGAESLLGQGDMLYLPPGSGVPNRVHGAFVDDHEVHAIVADWKTRGRPNYIPEILSGETTEENLLPGETLEDEDAEADPLFDQAVAFVTESRKASVSGVQRRFRIGYNRAARLVETMEQVGIVSGPGHNGNREVLAPPPPKGF
ncbi:DNA translocase FtsK 4TM domain-containing protein [Rheinheimera sp.]|uniref:DNA translocase FtsK n=1 Tax=Rheinheimera sp. TaxID=1869214 RepID=UPI003D2729B7